MKQFRTIALAAAASLVGGAMALADNDDTYYALSSPRIIQVPQPGDDLRRTQASPRSDAPDEFDDDDTPPPAPRAIKPQRNVHTKPQAKAAVRKPAEREKPSRRKPFSVALPEPPAPPPEPTGPKRALLSAPPPPPPTSSLHDGPTPLRPTPRFGQPKPEQPEPLTTFAPPPSASSPVAVAAPAAVAEPVIPVHAPADDDNEDHLPPPGDPKLAPPEPRD